MFNPKNGQPRRTRGVSFFCPRDFPRRGGGVAIDDCCCCRGGHTLIALPLGPGRESILFSVRDEKKPNKNNSAQQQQQNKKGETVWLKLDVERLLIASIITRLSRPAHFGGVRNRPKSYSPARDGLLNVHAQVLAAVLRVFLRPSSWRSLIIWSRTCEPLEY